ncbi:hypothetical protein GPJ56_000112 [Histomonas meleagridis]|uniref:uncharacterized protein n=1 Tax=Histomonas meleagridis TaxID=135588 RepID=UPI00355A435D|nr:hypothetical protein GPJ56_000112 [Histomonas meleagridis]KAH0805611.1 hypothetical protein GO595_001666 [Histomonas meleagridis]
MFFLLLSLPTLVYSIDKCQGNYSYESRFTRCILEKGESIDFYPQGQTALYLHNKYTSTASITSPLMSESIPDLTSGNGIQVLLSNFTVTCSQSGADNCFFTIWHARYDKDKASFVGDTAGCIYCAEEITVPSRYPTFFDFGDDARLDVRIFKHPRDTGLALTFFNYTQNDEVEIICKQNDTIPLKGPGLIHISSSKFSTVSFNIVVGSITKLDSEFSNDASVGMFASLKLDDDTGKVKYTEGSKDHKYLNYILASKEHREFQHIAFAMIWLTVLVFVVSVASLIMFLVSFSCAGKKKTESFDSILDAAE